MFLLGKDVADTGAAGDELRALKVSHPTGKSTSEDSSLVFGC